MSNTGSFRKDYERKKTNHAAKEYRQSLVHSLQHRAVDTIIIKRVFYDHHHHHHHHHAFKGLVLAAPFGPNTTIQKSF
jgi:hypothetical protein